MPTLGSSPATDVISKPLDTVRSLFDRADQPVNDRQNDWGVEGYFRELLSQPSFRTKVPLLTERNIDYIPSNSLCRFQGMVQDMMDPEYYVGAFKQPAGLWQTTKYTDTCPEAIDPAAETVVWDRKPLYCCRIPGQTTWSSAACAELLGQPVASSSGGGVATKRAREDGDIEMAENPVSTSAKSARSAENQAPHAPMAVPGTDLLAPQKGDCIVYVYEQEERLKLNDIVEFVGVLSRVPEMATVHLDLDSSNQQQAGHFEFMDDELIARPPTSLVPRVHAVLATKLKGTEELPLIPFKGSRELEAQATELRQLALDHIKPAVGGDNLAAQYLLLQLVSRVYSQLETAALGSLSLGLTNCPQAAVQPAGSSAACIEVSPPLSIFGEVLQGTLAALVPRCVGLPIDIQKLNSRSWRPGRDVKSNRLTCAPLQLADNTHLVLDEILLQPGQLTQVGVSNLGALKGLLENKKVEYDFNFYQLPISADVPVTVLSVGKPLLHASLDVILPLNPLTSYASPADMQAAAERTDLGPVRAYLGLVRHMDFSIQGSTASFLEAELVAARQQDRSLDAAAYHTWLTVARLLALSYGRSELTEGCWAEMKHLEHMRQQRIRAATGSSSVP